LHDRSSTETEISNERKLRLPPNGPFEAHPPEPAPGKGNAPPGRSGPLEGAGWHRVNRGNRPDRLHHDQDTSVACRARNQMQRLQVGLMVRQETQRGQVMDLTQAFLLGVMVAWTPSLIVLAVLLRDTR
jgi:hypothetical protein